MTFVTLRLTMLSIAHKNLFSFASISQLTKQNSLLLCNITFPFSFLKIQAAPPKILCLFQEKPNLHLNQENGRGFQHVKCGALAARLRSSILLSTTWAFDHSVTSSLSLILSAESLDVNFSP